MKLLPRHKEADADERPPPDEAPEPLPELEEERLSANIANGQIAIERRTMADTASAVTVTAPSGKTSTLALNKSEPGIWHASAAARHRSDLI